MSKSIIRENYSPLTNKLLDRLIPICDDYDFLKGAVVYLDTDEKVQKMLDFLDYTQTTDTDDIIPYALKIDDGLV